MKNFNSPKKGFKLPYKTRHFPKKAKPSTPVLTEAPNLASKLKVKHLFSYIQQLFFFYGIINIKIT